MGIPSYFSYIIKNYSNIIRTLESIKTEHANIQYLYMDCNSIIYDSLREIDSKEGDLEESLIEMVIQKIVHYIEFIRPTNTVFIAFDGVAPFAKMDQQRNRRYKSVMLSKISSAILSPSQTVVESKWSTSNITPGTTFMTKLNNKIHVFFTEYSTKHTEIKEIVVSGSNEPGEGEHKMFCHMRERFSEHTKTPSSDSVAVYGLDSDLIMLSIFHCKLVKNIYIFRETPEFIKSLVDLPCQHKENACSFMDISRLSWGILHELQCNGVNSHRIYDYVFLCFFLGNDFLPHFPSLNLRTSGMDTLLSTYRRVIGSNIHRSFISSDTLEIQWNWVSLFINELAKREHDLILEEYAVREKWDKRRWLVETSEERDFYVQSVPVIHRAEETFICPREKHWQTRYYQALFGESCDKMAVCSNYLEGLEWVFQYYTKECPHWQWKYEYAYPPLLSDLGGYLDKKLSVSKFSKSVPTAVIYPPFVYRPSNTPFSPEVQLAYVLPKQHRYLLSSSINEVLNSHEFMQYFPEHLQFSWAFCRYFWEAHVDLPDIPLPILQKWKELF